MEKKKQVHQALQINFKTFFIPLFQTMNVTVWGRILVSRDLPLVSLVEFVKN